MDLADYNHPRKKYLVGTELERYLQEKVQHPQQKPLNDIIVELIRVTTEYNQSRGVLTPWTTGSIHKYYNKAYHHNYQHLPDGCHLRETGLKFWAVKIARCIEKMEAGFQAGSEWIPPTLDLAGSEQVSISYASFSGEQACPPPHPPRSSIATPL